MNPDVGEVREYDTSMLKDKDFCGRIVYVVLEKRDAGATVMFLSIENESEGARVGQISWYAFNQPLFLFSDIVALGTC